MAQRSPTVKYLYGKMNLVKSQRDELCSLVDKYVGKITALGQATIDAVVQDLNRFQKTDSMLDTCLKILLQKCVEIQDISSGCTSVNTESDLPQTASSSGLPRQHAVAGASEAETGQTTRCDKMEDEIKKLKAATKKQEKRLDRGEEQLKHQDTRLSGVEDSVKQAEMKLAAKVEEIDSRVTTAVDQKLSDLQARHANTKRNLSSRLDAIDRELKETATKNAEVLIQSTSKEEGFGKRIENLEADGRHQSSRMENLKGEVQSLKNQYQEMRHSSRIENLEGEVQTLKSQITETRQSSRMENLERDVQTLKRQYSETEQSSKCQTRKTTSKSSTSHCSSVQKIMATQQASAQVFTPQTREELCFSSRCGSNVEVFNDNKSARKRNVEKLGNAIVMTNKALEDNEVFEIQLDKVNSRWSGWSIMIGVTTQQPSELKFPDNMLGIKSNIWMMYGNEVYHNGSVIFKNYGQLFK